MTKQSAVKHVARIGEALQARSSGGLRLAQRRQFGGPDRLNACLFGLLSGALGQIADIQFAGLATASDAPAFYTVSPSR